MQPRVQIAYGTAFDVIVAAASVADPTWRETFEAGPATYDRVRSVAGDDFVRRVAAFGRFGWINLVALVGPGASPWSLDGLISAVRSSTPDDLRLLMLGGDRRQLLGLVDEPTLRRAVRGDQGAREQLVVALASEELVIEATPWLLGAGSVDVQLAVVDLLQIWRDLLLPAEAETALASTLRERAGAAEALLATSTGRTYLDAVIGGLHYDPAGLDLVISVSSSLVAPVVVVVDGQTQTVILHPPVSGTEFGQGERARLLELGRAVGDKTRMQLLTMLQDGEKTAVELARGMRAPRTTLLHHLAILRAAGLIHVSVTPGGATVYRLRSDGFAELSEAATAFVPEA